MGEREEIWVRCKESFKGISDYEYEKGRVYKGFRTKREYYIEVPELNCLIKIPDPDDNTSSFKTVDPFLININKVLE